MYKGGLGQRALSVVANPSGGISIKKYSVIALGFLVLFVFGSLDTASAALHGIDIWGSFFEIDTVTGATTPIADTGATYIEGFTFTPYGYFLGTAYDSKGGMKVYRIELDGATTRLPNTNYSEVQGLAMTSSGILYGAESVSCKCLLQIDPLTGIGIKIGNGFGSAAPEMVGLAIDPMTNTMYGVNSVPGTGTVSTLYSISTTTGVATYVATINYPNVTTLAIDSEGNMFGTSGLNSTFLQLWTDGTFKVISKFNNRVLAIDFATPLAPQECSFTYGDWSACGSNNMQSRGVISSTPESCVGTPVTSQACVYVPPSCSYAYSVWSACQSNNTQTRTVDVASPMGCVGTPVLSQGCTYVAPACNYTYSAWGSCQSNSIQTRNVLTAMPNGCAGVPVTVQSCVYVPPACSYIYSEWGACQSNNTQNRTVVSSAPMNCAGAPVLSKSCLFVPPTATVSIDIKNGSEKNDDTINAAPAPINIKAGGITPVMIYSSTGFTANSSTINVASIIMGGTTVTKYQNVAKGLKVWFATNKFNFKATDTIATLTGKTKTNAAFTGTDTIKVVGGSTK